MSLFTGDSSSNMSSPSEPATRKQTTVIRGFQPSKNPVTEAGYTKKGSFEGTNHSSLSISGVRNKRVPSSGLDEKSGIEAACVNENAIDEDDDSSDWEDCTEGSAASSVSLIGRMVVQQKRRHRPVTPPAYRALDEKDNPDRKITLKDIYVREFSEELRLEMCWEHVSSTSAVGDARQRLSYKVASRKKLPARVYVKIDTDSDVPHWNHGGYLGNSNGYHCKGW